ncbi:MAG: hypothetical protein NMNS01_22070 [Nitrosomonas sp.]|jgi:serine/threonine-protein kinase RsbW|nr:MAG: hypothetical protein NMNS01_22070 [Nitrosomonas sp.]
MAERLIEFKPEIEDLARLEGELEAFGEEAGFEAKLIWQLNLILEELLTNTLSYGCVKSSDCWIKVALRQEGGILTIILTDNAVAFNPAVSGKADITAGLEDRKIGGLGIHIVTSFVDELAYKRIGDVNHLTLIKKI